MTPFRNAIKDIRIQAAVLLVLFIAAYWVPFSAMFNTWIENEDYSYGFLVPLISAYLIWDMRSSLKGIRPYASWSVLPVLIPLVLISIYGILGSSGNIAMPAVPLLIICFTAFSFGVATARKLLLPLSFLVFMVPVPAVIERTIGIYLKAISSKLGGEIIRLFDISVFVSGNIIDLGTTQLQVVDACNGLRYVFPLLALGIIYAYYFERILWKRIFCILATIPIAVLCNAARIGATGILAVKYGPGVAEGFFHGFSGWVMFVVGFCLLFLIGRILRLFPPKGPAVWTTGSGGRGLPCNTFTGIMSRPQGISTFIVSAILLLAVMCLSLSTKALPAVKIRGGIAAFPLAFSGWSGTALAVDPGIINLSGAEEAFSCIYNNTAGESVSLYIGYRETAFLSSENFFHSPTVCLPASGWKEETVSVHTIVNTPGFGKLKVTCMLISNLGNRQLVYFWFQTKDRASHDKNLNRLDLAMHALKRDNTYDMFFRTITVIKAGEDMEAGRVRMDAFVRDMLKASELFMNQNAYIETGE